MQFFDRLRLARRRGEVRPPAAGRLRPRPAARRSATTSTRCRTRSTRACSPTAAPSCASGSSAGADAAVQALARRRPRRRAGRRWSRTSAATTSGCSSTAYRACDAVTDRPSVVFAYTVKGWGLPIAGDPLNHAALLTPAQIDALRAEVGLTATTSGTASPPDSPAAGLCRARVGGEVNNVPVPPRPRLAVPVAVGALGGEAGVHARRRSGASSPRLGERRPRSRPGS